MPTQTWSQIASTLVTSTTGTVTFSSIPQTYTDLRVIWSGRMQASTDNLMFAYINGDTAANYIGALFYADGTAAPSGNYRTADTPGVLMWRIPTSSNATGFFNHGVVDYQSYTNTTAYKTFFSNRSSESTGLSAIWKNTAAITSLSFTMTGTSGWLANSVFTLYGIRSE